MTYNVFGGTLNPTLLRGRDSAPPRSGLSPALMKKGSFMHKMCQIPHPLVTPPSLSPPCLTFNHFNHTRHSIVQLHSCCTAVLAGLLVYFVNVNVGPRCTAVIDRSVSVVNTSDHHRGPTMCDNTLFSLGC